MEARCPRPNSVMSTAARFSRCSLPCPWCRTCFIRYPLFTLSIRLHSPLQKSTSRVWSHISLSSSRIAEPLYFCLSYLLCVLLHYFWALSPPNHTHRHTTISSHMESYCTSLLWYERGWEGLSFGWWVRPPTWSTNRWWGLQIYCMIICPFSWGMYGWNL